MNYLPPTLIEAYTSRGVLEGPVRSEEIELEPSRIEQWAMRHQGSIPRGIVRLITHHFGMGARLDRHASGIAYELGTDVAVRRLESDASGQRWYGHLDLYRSNGRQSI